MIYKQDLIDAIEETHKKPDDYHKCEKLATFYTLLDKLYPEASPEPVKGTGFSFDNAPEEMVGYHGTGPFLAAVGGMNARKAWLLMDELMDALSVINPRLHDSVMRKLYE